VREDAYDRVAADRTNLTGERTAALLGESSQARSRALWRRRMGVRR
jgi:D-inositol-3-phosphate glycosyltransferase